MYLCKWDICAEGVFVSFPWWLQNEKSKSKIALFFFKWVPFWNLSSKNQNDYILEKKINYTHTHAHTQKTPNNFGCDNYIFPKTRSNKSKQWTNYSPLKHGAGKNVLCIATPCRSAVHVIQCRNETMFHDTSTTCCMVALYLQHSWLRSSENTL